MRSPEASVSPVCRLPYDRFECRGGDASAGASSSPGSDHLPVERKRKIPSRAPCPATGMLTPSRMRVKTRRNKHYARPNSKIGEQIPTLAPMFPTAQRMAGSDRQRLDRAQASFAKKRPDGNGLPAPTPRHDMTRFVATAFDTPRPAFARFHNIRPHIEFRRSERVSDFLRSLY